jgi:hypothetical protein
MGLLGVARATISVGVSPEAFLLLLLLLLLGNHEDGARLASADLSGVGAPHG